MLKDIHPIFDGELKEDIAWRIEAMDRVCWGFLDEGSSVVPNLFKVPYIPDIKDDHDHCDGCWAKFRMDGVGDTLAEGYADHQDLGEATGYICHHCYRILCDVLSGNIEVRVK